MTARNRDGGLHRQLCAVAIVFAMGLWVLLAMRFALARQLDDIPSVVFAFFLGALAADGLTGLVHWACDTWGDEETPGLGPTLIYAFREHHDHPRRMLEGHWAHVNREPGLGAALVLSGLALPQVQQALAAVPALQAFTLSLVAFGASANQLHSWAHQTRPPRVVKLAQRLGLVLSPLRHAQHHRNPNTAAYCISTGWLNPILDRIDFWRGLERLVSRTTGATARAGQSRTKGIRST